MTTPNRLLIIDDNPTIHEDIKKILCPERVDPGTQELAEALFGAQPKAVEHTLFQIDSAFQGQEGLAKVEAAVREGSPYTMAFVDVRMPPGWDGIETVRRIWDKYPEMQVVICTAYSDRSWEDIVVQLGHTDSLVILKKPFDNVEVLQLAHALTKKWSAARETRARVDTLDDLVRDRTNALSQAHEQLQSEVRKRAGIETALRASEERFYKAFQAALTPAAVIHRESQRCVEVNDNFLALTGRTRQEMVGHTAEELQLPAEPEAYRRLFEMLKENQLVRDHRCLIRRRDGEVRETLISLEPVLMGGQDCLLLAARDVTELRTLESQLRKAQKMEAVGHLAANVAHDFNDLLTVIQCHTSLQLSRASFDIELADSLNEVKLAADRASALTKQLLAFSRRQVLKRRPLDLIQAVERVCLMMQETFGKSISLVQSFAPVVPPVFADETSVEQILINLIVNAHDATPPEGKISIHAAPMKVALESARFNPDARPGDFVCLQVADTGTGIAPEVLPRIFEPFFTTKPKGQGAGLGLATVYGIAKQHEGWVEVDSKPGAGATFRVFLPVAEKSPSSGHRSPAKTASQPPPSPATILVAEDEHSLRKLICNSLAKQGYRILQAADAVQARQVWQSASPPVDLLIIDINLPDGASGRALASQLLEESERLRVLYISGFPPQNLDHSEIFQEGVNYLVKPFPAPRLIKVVEQCLQTPTGRD